MAVSWSPLHGHSLGRIQTVSSKLSVNPVLSTCTAALWFHNGHIEERSPSFSNSTQFRMKDLQAWWELGRWLQPSSFYFLGKNPGSKMMSQIGSCSSFFHNVLSCGLEKIHKNFYYIYFFFSCTNIILTFYIYWDWKI